MAIKGLDHITIHTADLDRARAFYEAVLGLRSGDRPPFRFSGAWLYCDAAPIVHLVHDDVAQGGSTAPIDHVAFAAGDLGAVIARLSEYGIAYDYVEVPGRDMRQVFVRDPDGVRIELNFGPGERLPETHRGEAGR